MARPLKEIELELLSPPQQERAELAHRLIVSLDEGKDDDVDAYWRNELDRRQREIENGTGTGTGTGTAELIPAEEAMRKARAELKK